MKKIIVFVICVYLLGLNSFVWAGDTLIKTLKEKGVITEEEASNIMTEAAKEKKSVLPKGLEGISIGGGAYIDYSAGTTNKDHPRAGKDVFFIVEYLLEYFILLLV